ncbi:MAG TPA: hypothetical protein VLF60_00960 [Candidatus Saccharimonadales bacterium]|nr:hypothetical protein [Candidatus Saccharimonadales bacterium]
MCTQCRQSSPLQHIWVLGDYEGALERLIHVFKFGRARAAAEILAMAMDARLPQLPAATVIVPLPTAPRRVRQRGYDQAVLMARALASHRELTTRSLLLRNHNQRQLGASKALRHQQAAEAYRLARQPVALDQPLLLIDDVITTGASLTAAARLLSAAGYHNVMAVVAAKRPFKK